MTMLNIDGIELGAHAVAGKSFLVMTWTTVALAWVNGFVWYVVGSVSEASDDSV